MRGHVITRIGHRSLLVTRNCCRCYSQPTLQPPKRKEEGQVDYHDFNEPTEPRPRWFFTASTFLRVVLVPSILAYGIFVHDFGDNEHVFMPPRRWMQAQKDAFFALSPEEREMVEMGRESTVDTSGK